ncbi:MAG: radical SAM protein [Pseudomonadota bacterium]
MKIIASTGRDDLATVYIAEMGDSRRVEFVESVQPPLPREKKWVLIISTMFGCPAGCLMCDAGGDYHGTLSREEIISQIDFLVDRRWAGRKVPCEKFKIQFARLGEPSLNPAVLDVLEELPDRYNAPGLMPSISTIAPAGGEAFFERLLSIKSRLYSEGRFQMQFSLHTTDESLRGKLMPVKKWSFENIAEYGDRFYSEGDRKIALNFALAKDAPVEPCILAEYFDPAKFLIKITPVNPTHTAAKNNISSLLDPQLPDADHPLARDLCAAGFEVIVSLGETEENLIGSNCGQYLRRHIESKDSIENGYTYGLRMLRAE